MAKEKEIFVGHLFDTLETLPKTGGFEFLMSAQVTNLKGDRPSLLIAELDGCHTQIGCLLGWKPNRMALSVQFNYKGHNLIFPIFADETQLIFDVRDLPVLLIEHGLPMTSPVLPYVYDRSKRTQQWLRSFWQVMDQSYSDQATEEVQAARLCLASLILEPVAEANFVPHGKGDAALQCDEAGLSAILKAIVSHAYVHRQTFAGTLAILREIVERSQGFRRTRKRLEAEVMQQIEHYAREEAGMVIDKLLVVNAGVDLKQLKIAFDPESAFGPVSIDAELTLAPMTRMNVSGNVRFSAAVSALQRPVDELPTLDESNSEDLRQFRKRLP